MSPFLYKWLKFSLLALVAGGFIALAIYALVMRDEIKNSQIEPPLVEAPTQPLKTRPETPGGLEFPNQDKLVFDLLENTAPSGTVGSSAIAAPEATGAAAASSLASPSVAVEAPAAAAETSPTQVPVASNLPTEAVQPEAVAPAVKPAVAAKPAVVAETKTEPTPEPKPATKLAGSWGVQLAAVGSKADGEKVAKQLQGKFSALQSLNIRIVPAPNSNRYRVQFVGLNTRNAAQAVCDKLGSQPCFPVGK